MDGSISLVKSKKVSVIESKHSLFVLVVHVLKICIIKTHKKRQYNTRRSLICFHGGYNGILLNKDAGSSTHIGLLIPYCIVDTD